MIKEVIKELKGIPDYYISDKGIVYTTKIAPRQNPNGDMMVLQPRLHPSGYKYVGLFVGKGPSKQRLWRRVHRLVYETHVGKIKSGYEIDHKDGDKHNNNLNNLRAVTHSENMLSAFQRRRKRNEKN